MTIVVDIVFSVQCVRDPVTHFAQCFNEAFKGPGTDDERLIQLIVSRSEVSQQGTPRRS